MAYLFLGVSPSCLDENIRKLIWNQLMPAKVSVFIWCLFLNHLLTKDNLIQRGVDLVFNPARILCGSYMEDVNHVFAKCKFSQSLWNRICYWWGLKFIHTDHISHLLLQLCSLPIPKKACHH
ncbi:hypothetical protein SLE2022_127660 [Rubroshorea leprosula]